MYEPMVLPTSQLPPGFPSAEMVYTYNPEGISAMMISATAPRYFPKTISLREIGLVNKSSMVPILISSLKARIHTAGIKKIKTHGANSKKGDKSAKPESKILKFPLKTQRNSPLTIRNRAITKYPIVLEKKEFISRFTIDII